MIDFLLNVLFIVIIAVILLAISAGAYFFITWQLPNTVDPLVHYPEVLRTLVVITGLSFLLEMIVRSLPEDDE